MDAPANIVTLHAPAGRVPVPASAATSLPPVPPPANLPAAATRISVERDRMVVDRLVLVDASRAAFVAERPAEERAGLVERALKIGLTALMDAGVTVNVDAVRAEFATLLRQTEDANAKAAAALDQLLRQNFADGDGRLPRTLEAFLGDRGKLRSLTDELFDETKRDSAIGRIKTLLGAYLEAASTARAQERAKGTAKGGDFEDLLEALLADTARGAGDLLDRTSAEEGAVIKSKKGDFVLTVNPALTGGTDLRIVVEAKDRAMSGRAMRQEIREAKTNRDAVIGLVVFTPAHAPTGIAPFDYRAGDVYAVIDPECPDPAVLEAAVRFARLLAIASLCEREIEVDAEAIGAALTGIREQLEQLRTLKSTLTSVVNSTKDVQTGLDRMRDAILARVVEAEAAVSYTHLRAHETVLD